MNEQSAHEQLSAYLDDELSPEERAVVESLLAESPAARQELAELRQVRELLISLPSDSLAETFPAEVLHACEQHMLLDDVRPAAPQSDPQPKSKRSRLAVWAGMGGLLASVVLVGITMSWWNSGGEMMDMAMNSDRESAATRTLPDELMPISRTGEAEHGVSEEAELTDSVVMQESFPPPQALRAPAGVESDAEREMAPMLARSKVAPSATMSDMAGAAPEQPRELKKMAVEGSPAAASAAETLSLPADANLAFKDDLKTAQVGEVVRALQRQNDQVIVVELTVVDRRQGLEDLQLLLARHRIPLDRPAEKLATAKTDSPQTQSNSPKTPNALLAVHVEAPSDRLQAALAELRSAAAVAEIKQRPSISPTQLAMASDNDQFVREGKPFAAQSADKPRTQPFAGPMRKSAARRALSEPEIEESSAKPDRIPATEVESVDDQTERKVELASRARQRRLIVRNEVLVPSDKRGAGSVGIGGAMGASALRQAPGKPAAAADTGFGGEEAPRPPGRMRVKSSPRSLAKANELKASAQSERPVQLLFILVSQDPQPPPPPLPEDAGAA
ncbi:anti-sigma factor [Thalassoroseus pseudoceratinae]|uniref:anti-sigma factor n=1 Tax=Thalassoroseus pseudoceratinae TaxID=2713176 RepID=UPI0014228A9C|nr:zf-HC2 domain-containing protein [Thalassoroseus pseudoceratinae]